MDTRVELIEKFYQTMRRDKVKIESKQYGFGFIKQLTEQDIKVDYVQMENNLIHKYRLLNVSEECRMRFIEGHINQDYNVCFYFDESANNTLCFNIDNNFIEKNHESRPEIELVRKYIEQHLAKYGIETLSVKSGRGYHQWCRFAKPIDNQLLLNFMVRIAAKALASLHYEHYDYHAVKINMSPNPKFVDVLSLRAFGSKHIKTGQFSYIKAGGEILDEQDSWRYVSDFIINKTVSQKQFMLASDDLAKTIAL